MTIEAIECLGIQILRCEAKERMMELERTQLILFEKLGDSDIKNRIKEIIALC